MAIKDIFKVSRKTFFNPGAWLGWDIIKAGNEAFFATLRGVFLPPPIEVGEKETFEEALKKYNISEEELARISHNYFLFAIFFLCLAIGVLAFGFYLIFTGGHFTGLIIALAITIFLTGQAFSYHFWYFQIKHRKLGCTFEEWRRGKPDKGASDS
jgi:intracellular multiplication protein IcmV